MTKGAARNYDTVQYSTDTDSIIASGTDFLIEGIPVALYNDLTQIHQGHLIGDHNFIIRNKSIQTMDDQTDDGGTIISSSNTFLINN